MVEKLALIKAKDKGLFDKIKSFFDGLVKKIREVYAGLSPDSAEGKYVAEMKDAVERIQELFSDALVDASENYQQSSMKAQKNTADEVGIKYNQREKFSEYNKPITLDDIKLLRNIGRKSINEFTTDEIEVAQKWAYKFYQQLGTKSPFFRRWFGDWRAYDNTPVDHVDTLKDNRSKVTNKDTGWIIQTSKKVHKETSNHRAKAEKNAVKYLPYIDDITEKAVLFDSVISDNDNENSMFFHTLYAYTEVLGYPALLKLRVE